MLFACLFYDLCIFIFIVYTKRQLLILVFQNSAPVAQENSRPADITPAKKKKEVNAGQIERCVGFLAANKLQLRKKSDFVFCITVSQVFKSTATEKCFPRL